MPPSSMRFPLVALVAWLLLGVMPARAQIDDISRQMGVNTTSALSPGNDRTNTHRGFDPGSSRSATVSDAQLDAIRRDLGKEAIRPKAATRPPAITSHTPVRKKPSARDRSNTSPNAGSSSAKPSSLSALSDEDWAQQMRLTPSVPGTSSLASIPVTRPSPSPDASAPIVSLANSGAPIDLLSSTPTASPAGKPAPRHPLVKPVVPRIRPVGTPVPRLRSLDAEP